MLNKIFIDVLIACSPLLVALIGYLSALVAKKINETTKNELLSGTLVRLNETVWRVVLDIQQTVVEGLKKANADGKLTDEEKETIKKMAFERIKALVNFQEIAKVFGFQTEKQTEAFVNSYIESSVFEMKNGGEGKVFPFPNK